MSTNENSLTDHQINSEDKELQNDNENKTENNSEDSDNENKSENKSEENEDENKSESEESEDEMLLSVNFSVKDNSELIKFRKEVSELSRSISGAEILMREYKDKLEFIKVAITTYPNADLKLLENVRAIKLGLSECDVLYNGDGIKASKEVETPPSFAGRLGTVTYQLFESTSGVTTSQKENMGYCFGNQFFSYGGEKGGF
jgi:hypothetical protein